MKKQARLSETEMQVLRIIWELGTPVTVSQLLGIFEESKGWKTSTLSTILARLIEKGFLTKSPQGKANLYSPVISLSEYKKRETNTLLSTFYNGSVKSFLAALVDDAGITQSEIEELKEWFQGKAGDV